MPALRRNLTALILVVAIVAAVIHGVVKMATT